MTLGGGLATRRPAGAGDEPFLRLLDASVREPEFAALGLGPAALQSLLAMQYEARDRSYRQGHPGADFELVLAAGEPVGRMIVDRRADAIHLVDIALLPEHRGQGIGTWLLEQLLAEGRASGRAVTLNVARTHAAALRLYRRLGFSITHADDVYADLQWRPPALS